MLLTEPWRAAFQNLTRFLLWIHQRCTLTNTFQIRNLVRFVKRLFLIHINPLHPISIKTLSTSPDRSFYKRAHFYFISFRGKLVCWLFPQIFYFSSSWLLFLMAFISAFHFNEDEYKLKISPIYQLFCPQFVKGTESLTVHVTWNKAYQQLHIKSAVH